MNSTSPISDYQRILFMQKLAQNLRSADALALTDWEEQFHASWRQSSRPSLWFTPGRRPATDRMWQKYGTLIDLPFPLFESKPEPIADADPDACQFIVRLDGRSQRCNDPAAMMRGNGFRYCSAHADQVQRDLKRGGKVIHLIPFRGTPILDRHAPFSTANGPDGSPALQNRESTAQL